MLFNSAAFLLLFLPATLLLTALAIKIQSVWGRAALALASLIFYAAGDIHHALILVVSTAFNYWVGSLLQNADSRHSSRRKTIATIGIAANLGNLAFFKYLNLLTSTLADVLHVSGITTDILLPLGISFYTFTQIAYIADCYSGKVRHRGVADYCLFVWYFPHQIAGPILHHKEMISQFRSDKFSITSTNMLIGLSIFSMGLFKKVVFADWFSTIADPVFNGAHSGAVPTFFEAWFGAIAYGLQIYFDFSAYSDMAIGISYIFGIKLPMNFNSPYKSLNIIEFWRTWHMTLSRFLRDYLYIPLGGNRNGPLMRHRNLFITMTLGGLWHGASWNFLAWGALHGTYLTLNHVWQQSRLARSIRTSKPVAWAITMMLVTLAWVYFRAVDFASANTIVKSMLLANHLVLPEQLAHVLHLSGTYVTFSKNWAGALIYPPHIATIAAGILWCVTAPNINDLFRHVQPTTDAVESTKGPDWKGNLSWVFLSAFCLGVSVSRFGSNSAFIYFNF